MFNFLIDTAEDILTAPVRTKASIARKAVDTTESLLEQILEALTPDED